MTDVELLDLIARLQRGEGGDDVATEWIAELERGIPCPRITDLIFFGEPSDTPEDILRKAREYRPIQL